MVVGQNRSQVSLCQEKSECSCVKVSGEKQTVKTSKLVNWLSKVCQDGFLVDVLNIIFIYVYLYVCVYVCVCVCVLVCVCLCFVCWRVYIYIYIYIYIYMFLSKCCSFFVFVFRFLFFSLFVSFSNVSSKLLLRQNW
jgi:hypothetical protein